jgi:hypothetical protein
MRYIFFLLLLLFSVNPEVGAVAPSLPAPVITDNTRTVHHDIKEIWNTMASVYLTIYTTKDTEN